MEDTVIYVIDGSGTIISVNENWDRFASGNDAPDLVRDAVLGRPLMDFIDDRETRYLYKVIIEKVRTSDRPVALPFRCDSPELRRHMEMVISPLDEGRVNFTCRLLRTEERWPVELIRADQAHSDEFLHMCSWCKKIQLPEDEWTEAEDAIARLELFNAALLPGITHITCPPCAAEVLRNLDVM